MTEPNQTVDFATKVVKDSIAEVKGEMPKELSRSIRFTASAHAYSWVVPKRVGVELIAWLEKHGFSNITTDVNSPDGGLTTVTATADAATNDGCPPAFTCGDYTTSQTCASEGKAWYKSPAFYYYYNCAWINNNCEKVGQPIGQCP